MDWIQTLEYAAACLEQDDPGGTLPGSLRQYAEAYGDLLAACEALLEIWEGPARDYEVLSTALEQARAAIAKARGER